MLTTQDLYDDGKEAGAQEVLDQIRELYWAARISTDPTEARFYERLLNQLIEGRKKWN